MLIISITTTLLQIFCELLLYCQVTLKIVRVADDTFERNFECEWAKLGITGAQDRGTKNRKNTTGCNIGSKTLLA